MQNRGACASVVLAVSLVLVGLRAAASQPPDVSGSWVLVEVMPAVINLPIVGPVEMTTITALLVRIEQVRTELTVERTYCFQEVRTAPPLVTTVIPDRFVASLCPFPLTAWLEETPQGWRFVQPLCVDVRGARLVDPEHEALPTEATDPRVFDQDGDGHPGLTIHVALAGLLGGDAYVVNRTCTALEGWVLEDGSIYGAIRWSSEQNVIAARDPLLLTSYVYTMDPDPTKHFFLMRRVSGPDLCLVIRNNLSSLLRLPPG
ncbi:MAG: hypothetical protein PHU43_09210 [Candidatus Bipolaricaulis sp.]|nr:hypothetical protein [Candidatus Bipolaricaulis sp.]